MVYVSYSLSQTNIPITIQGKVYEKHQKVDFLRVIIVNQRTGIGKFGNQDGSFEIQVLKNDTVVVSVLGYQTIKLCYVDSLYAPVYKVNIPVEPIEINLPAVSVFPKRDLKRIYEDISKLGYSESDYKISGINALESPITFLYQSLSKRAKKERLAIELQNEQRRRDLLKELLGKYADAQIIDLDERSFDVFIDYCKISDFLLQNTTQYEFIQIIRQKYQEFSRYGY